MSETEFPNASSLCERCGYALRGLPPQGACPECGLLIAGSHPGRRTGPAWERRMSPRSAAVTFIAFTSHPARAFRTMRVDGPNLPGRMFLLMMALAVGVLWLAGERLVLGTPAVLAWLYAMLAVQTAVALAYIEVLGVTYFSGRRGWRVPVRLAERVACYASVGLPVAAVLMLGVRIAAAAGWPAAWWAGWADALVAKAMILCGALALSVLGFEALVWLGVRQVRFANHEIVEGDDDETP